MNKLFSKRTVYSVIGLIIGVAIVYFISYSTLIKPMKAELASTNENVALFEAHVNNGSPPINQDQSIKNATESIPTSEQPDKVLLSIGDFASKANVTINLIESGDVDDSTASTNSPEGIEKVRYTLEATATTLENANTFLSSLKNSERLFIVDNLTVNKTENDISLIVTFTAFHTTY